MGECIIVNSDNRSVKIKEMQLYGGKYNKFPPHKSGVVIMWCS
jgi:hypothetical protein